MVEIKDEDIKGLLPHHCIFHPFELLWDIVHIYDVYNEQVIILHIKARQAYAIQLHDL